MYFTNTPALNSMEAIMKKLPYGTQKGGGRFRRLYQYTKKDCDCRLCLYYRKKNGCTLALCPVLDIRLGCGAATIGDAVKAVFKDAQNTAWHSRQKHQSLCVQAKEVFACRIFQSYIRPNCHTERCPCIFIFLTGRIRTANAGPLSRPSQES